MANTSHSTYSGIDTAPLSQSYEVYNEISNPSSLPAFPRTSNANSAKICYNDTTEKEAKRGTYLLYKTKYKGNTTRKKSTVKGCYVCDCEWVCVLVRVCVCGVLG